jgi:hypothetical protein
MPPSPSLSRLATRPRVVLLFLAIFAWTFAPTGASAGDEPLYGRSILLSVPAVPSDAFKAAAAQLQTTLERMTGQTFSLITDTQPCSDKTADKTSGLDTPGNVIVLATTDSPLVTESMRKRFDRDAGGKAVLVRTSEDSNRLWIVSPTQTGLEQGVYVFLEELGCRWFVSGKNWDVVPKKNDIRVRLDVLAKDGCDSWPGPEVESREFSNKIAPLGRFGMERKKLSPSEMSPQVYIRGEVDLTFDARGNQTDIAFKLRIQRAEADSPAQGDAGAKPAPGPAVQLIDADGKIVGEQKSRADFEWEDVAFKIPRAGLYRIRIASPGLIGIQAPQRFALALTHYRGQVLDAWKSRLYFFVPKGLSRVALYTHSRQPITIYDPNGNAIKLARAQRLVVFDVPEGMDGKPWSFTDETSTRDIEMLNVPPYLSFYADGLLIPDNTDRRREK